VSTPENADHAKEEVATAGHLQFAVWYGTQNRPVSDDFAIEIVGHETWKPTYGPWEVKHTFDNLIPDEPYELLIHSGDLDSQPISLRFWAPQPRAREQTYPDYLIDLKDDELVLVNPGFRSTERRHPRTGPALSMSMSRLKRLLPTRWGSGALFGLVIGITALLYLVSAFDDDDADTPAARSALPSETVQVTLRAIRLEGSEKMLVSFENDSGGTEEHVILDETWELNRTIASYDSLWMDVQNLSDAGAVRCELLIDGEPLVEATSSGPRVTAGCYGYPNQNVE
jgi:hypothetical protein